MDLRQMEYLVALVDEEQFTRAAALTGVSQSGLSASIRALEAELGVTLFTRTTRRVEPTDAGLALLPYARAMLEQAGAGRDAVVRATRALSGTLAVGAEQCLGVLDVPSLLERFHRRYPQVAIDFTQAGSYDLLARVRSGAMDVAFVASSDHLGTLARTPIATRPVVLLVPPEHPLASSGRAGKVDWADLDDEDFVDFDPSWAVRGLNDRAATAHGIRRRVRCTVNDIHTLLDLLHRGLGIALVPLPISAKPQAAGLATVRLPAGETPQWEVSAVTGSGSSPAPQLLELLEAAAPTVALPEPALA